MVAGSVLPVDKFDQNIILILLFKKFSVADGGVIDSVDWVTLAVEPEAAVAIIA